MNTAQLQRLHSLVIGDLISQLFQRIEYDFDVGEIRGITLDASQERELP
jgi:hypothetical protein